MLLKLIQRGDAGEEHTIDIADSIDKLDFPSLRGSNDWKIYVIWGYRGACIAHVVWRPAAAYQICTHYVDVAGIVYTARNLSIIVPSVKERLKRLFQNGTIDQLHQNQPIVLVRPSE